MTLVHCRHSRARDDSRMCWYSLSRGDIGAVSDLECQEEMLTVLSTNAAGSRLWRGRAGAAWSFGPLQKEENRGGLSSRRACLLLCKAAKIKTHETQCVSGRYTQTCVGESHGNVCSCRSVDISVDIYMQMRQPKNIVSASCRMCCHILSICVVSCLQVPHSKLLQHKINTSAMTPMSIRVQH